ncbi:hypothetical protein M5689_000509 [Euphorbia peplus]|nr:hypothetical protein M5689_000509 [Euphorbia peplus]
MAPTAAMLILSRHIKSTSPPSLSPPAASLFGFKLSDFKWVHEKDTIFKGKVSELSMPDHQDCGMEKMFREALQHSFWW